MVSDVGSRQVTLRSSLLYTTLLPLSLCGPPPTTSLCQRHQGMQKLWHYWRRAHSPCLSSLTEKNEERAIFASSSRPIIVVLSVVRDQSFSITRKSQVSAKCDASRWEKVTRDWVAISVYPGWMDRSRKRHYEGMAGRCLTASATWEKFQSGIMKYRAN